jgi:UDP-GlcNAc:undecaprenyl-phosphate/decaprenyl-phosphate GlcNAc-1-phosphate transferase
MLSVFLVSFFLTPLIIRSANRLRLLDRPQEDKIHRLPTPRLGGLAVYLAFSLGVILVSFVFNVLPFRYLAWIFLSVSCIFATGLVDDLFNIRPRLKLGLVTLSGIFLVPAFPLEAYPLWLRLLSYLTMIVWIDYLSNSFNLLDGLDGLCSGTAILAAFFLFLMAILTGQETAAWLSLLLMPALAGFILFNFSPARIFLGDGGSYFIGGVLAIIAIIILEVPTLQIIPVLWVLAVPVIDTSSVLLRRVLIRGDMLHGDLMHSYNLLLKKTGSVWPVLFTAFLSSFAFGLAGVWLFFAGPVMIVLSLIVPVAALFYFMFFSNYFKG